MPKIGQRKWNMTIERGDDMRGKMLIYLALLCLALAVFFAGVANYQERDLEQERVRLESEIELLEAENAYLRSRAQELRSRQSEVLHRMQDWLDAWEVQEVEITGYAPLDPRAVPGVCYSGDPGVTSSGAKTTPGVTVAAPPDINYNTRIYFPGRGEMRVIHDRGERVGYTEDGVMRLDLCVETREEALNEIGRERTIAVIEKRR
jgi:hypothetical protein